MKATGYITRLFGNGQKVDGWFAGLFETVDYKTLHVSGVCKNEIDMSMKYDITAEITYHEKFGKQYSIRSMVPHIELDRDSLIQYLSSNQFKGIGPKTAELIVDTFGKNTLDHILSDPDDVKQKCKLSDAQIHSLVKGEMSLSVENQLRKIYPAIHDSLITKIINKYCDGDGEVCIDSVIELIKTNTYQLLYDLDNVSFKEIDEIALHVGYDKYADDRIKQCYSYTLTKHIENTRNSYVNVSDPADYNALYAEVLYNVGYMDAVANAYGSMVYSPECIAAVNNVFYNPDRFADVKLCLDDAGNTVIYPHDVYEAENGVSKILANHLMSKSLFIRLSGCTMMDIQTDIQIYEKKHRMKFDDSQKTAILSTLMSSVSIINGGPGHGKTSTVDCILFIWSRHITKKQPVLSAPTGRAVTVLKNATGGEYDVSTAMHMIYMGKYYNKRKEQKDRKMKYSNTQCEDKSMNEFFDRLSENLVILDECSMVGIQTAYQFLSLFHNCQFLFVGDVDQLMPIEYGQFFRDICDCGSIMKTTLTTNYRANGKVIVDNATYVNQGYTQKIDLSTPDEFSFINAFGDFSDAIIDEYKNIVFDKNGVLDPLKLKSVCIISPITKGSTGVNALNAKIQDIVNPADPFAKTNQRGYVIDSTHMYLGDQYKDIKLRVGDMVMMTKNHPEIMCHIIYGNRRQPSAGIYNGDTGVIMSYTEVDDTMSVEILLNDGRTAIIQNDNIKELVLAYAMTVHKSQGSEYENVIFAIQDWLSSMHNTTNEFACRNLIYTAITRAKYSIKIIGSRFCFDNCVANVIQPRKSMLKSRILQHVLSLKSGGE